MRRQRCWQGLGVFTAGILSTSALAQTVIVTDGTLGPALDLSDVNALIPADLGQTRGANLFHSFERFDIGTLERATFTGPADIANVISRVTGGQLSRIDGILASEVGNADVWLVNPAGVLFGPSSGLDIPAGFHVATANEVRFGDGARFSASDPTGGSLTVAPPESFGFLGGGNGRIEANGSRLLVAEGQELTLASGGIELSTASLDASGGQISLATRTDAGEIGVGDSFVLERRDGRIEIGQGSSLRTSGPGGGRLRISGGEILVSGFSTLFADNTGDEAATGGVEVFAASLSMTGETLVTADSIASGKGGNVIIDVADVLVASDSIIASGAFANGDGGSVSLNVDRLTIDDEDGFRYAGISSNALRDSTGNGGIVSIVADDIVIRDGGVITGSTFGAGSAGGVDIRAGTITIEGNGVYDITTGIVSNATPGSTGNAGQVSIAADTLAISRRGEISSSTFGPGDAAGVTIGVETLTIDGEAIADLTGVASAAGSGSTGNAGAILVIADDARLNDGGQISSVTLGSGMAGAIQIEVGTLNIDGGALLEVPTGIFSSAEPGSLGDAGIISVQAMDLTIVQGGAISSGSFAQGAAGSIAVDTGRLVIDGAGFADGLTGISSAANPGSSGDAGSIGLLADAFILKAGGQVASSTFSLGSAGGVAIDADRIEIDGGALSGLVTSIASNAESGSAGDAGNVTVRVDDLRIQQGGSISSSTFAVGMAGDVSIEAEGFLIDGRAFAGGFTGVASNANLGSAGDAGSISIISDQLELRGGGTIASLATEAGQAGDIVIAAGDFLIDDQGQAGVFTGVSSSTNSDSTGHAGRVSVFAEDLRLLGGGVISSASNGTGLAGDLVIEGGRITLRDSAFATSAANNAGGRIDVTAQQAIRLSNGQITTSGALPSEGASLLSLAAPFVEIIDRSRVVSLTGDGVIVPQSPVRAGAAIVDGVITVISPDSEIAASTSLIVLGNDSQVGSELQLPDAVPADVSRNLSTPCAVTAGQSTSSFVSRRDSPSQAPDGNLGSTNMNSDQAQGC